MAKAKTYPKTFSVDVPATDRLAFDSENRLLAVGSSDENVAVILELPAGDVVARIEEGWRLQDMQTFEFLGDKLLALRHQPEPACVLFDIESASFEVLHPTGSEYPQGATLDPSGRLLAVGYSSAVELYDVEKREVRWRQSTHFEGACERPAFSSDGRYLVAPYMMYPSGALIAVYESATGNRLRTLETDDSDSVVALRGDARSLAVGEDGVRLYDRDAGDKPTVRFDKPTYPSALTFLDDGQALAVLGGDGLFVYDLTTGKRKRGKRSGGTATATAKPSPDWSLVANVTEEGVHVWPTGLDSKKPT